MRMIQSRELVQLAAFRRGRGFECPGRSIRDLRAKTEWVHRIFRYVLITPLVQYR
jgi:hypothetical protein